MTPQEIQIIHMQRSGGHAFMGWLMHQLGQNGQKVFVINDIASEYAMKTWPGANICLPEGTTHILYNLEDVPATQADCAIAVAKQHLPIRGHGHRFLLLRDPLNLFASRKMYRQECQLGNVTRAAVACWNTHADTVFRARHWDPRVCPFRPILYDEWAGSLLYRRKFWEVLFPDIPFTDAGKEEVPEDGGGSSFDGMNLNGRASEMDVLNRYKAMPDGFYERLFTKDTFEWADVLFGMRL